VSRYYSRFATPAEARDRWDHLVTEPPSMLAFDTETVSLTDRTLLGIGVAQSGVDAFYVTADDPEFYKLINLLKSTSIRKIWHNAPFDVRVLRSREIDYSNIDDTAIMARMQGLPAVLEEASYWVNRQTERAVNTLARFNATSMSGVPERELAYKCIIDSEATWLLREMYWPRIDHEYYEVERQIVPMLEEISQKGVRLDQARRDELDAYYSKEVAWYETVASNMGFSPSKNMQVGWMLSDMQVFLPMTRKKTMLATDNETLNKIESPLRAVAFAQFVLGYRHVAKMLSTYIKPYVGLARAYTTLHMDAITGRVSSTHAAKNDPDRNLQNITKKAEKGGVPTIRSMFIPDEGDDVFTRADYSQLQLRILAHMSGDRRMLGVFMSGGDIHSDTAEGMRVTRDSAKTFNYAVIFGADAKTIADKLNTKDIARVREYMKRWMETYPQAAQWLYMQQELGLSLGYVLTLFGRKMMIPMDQGEQHARNCSVNYPIQGTEAEIVKRGMLVCRDAFMPAIRLQVHDELLNSGRVVIPSGMADLTPVHAPLDVEYVSTWG